MFEELDCGGVFGKAVFMKLNQANYVTNLDKLKAPCGNTTIWLWRHRRQKRNTTVGL